MSASSPPAAVTGLGAMGSRVAAVLHDRGIDVTVWNRDTSKTRPLAEVGVAVAPSFLGAVGGADIVFVVFSTYDVLYELLDGFAEDLPLAGKVIVNLVTGTAGDACIAEQRVQSLGGLYLDAGNMCYPRSIGASDGVLLCAGSLRAWKRAESMVRVIAPSSRYLGEAVALLTRHTWWLGTSTSQQSVLFTRPVHLLSRRDLTTLRMERAVRSVFTRLNDFLEDAVNACALRTS